MNAELELNADRYQNDYPCWEKYDLCRDDVLFYEVLADNLNSTFNINLISLDVNLGVGRSFIRSGNTSEF